MHYFTILCIIISCLILEIGHHGGIYYKSELFYFPLETQLLYIFLSSSAGKESACNAGDPGSIPGSGRSAGEGVGYPPLYSWASLVAQMVKNLPALWETWIGKIPWRREPLPNSSILIWRNPWTEEATVHGVAKSWT